MVSRKERLQRIWHQFDSRRDHKPSNMRQAAAWAVDIAVYNEINAGKRPAIQLVLDYRDDVAEREELMRLHFRRHVA
jgi:hypothetical protein